MLKDNYVAETALTYLYLSQYTRRLLAMELIPPKYAQGMHTVAQRMI